MDFSLLEREFLDRVIAGRTPQEMAGVRAILVDEYQDTNLLQEQIYLNLARALQASLTVVGDDDQSLYRFRGATIELFRDFSQRATQALGCAQPRLVYLTENYRSAPEVVDFYNAFVVNDPDFHGARIQPPKPAIHATQPSEGLPVLGLFRPDEAQLADGLAEFLHQVFRGGGWPGTDTVRETIRRATNGGDLGDAVFVGSTVAEFGRAYFGQPPKPRMPLFLRNELAARGLACFNPRGRALKDVPEVQQLLGLVLECLEPGATGLSRGQPMPLGAGQARLTNEATRVMAGWRTAAQALIAASPPSRRRGTLAEVMQGWRDYVQRGAGARRNASEWPLLDVFYSFVPFIPSFQDDPEGQVYLEAISRCAAQAATFSPFRALLLREAQRRQPSAIVAIRDVLAPIAEDLVQVDEDVMPSVPRDRLNIMTIHQIKGLEFPLVIVDVGSGFKGNYEKQRFRRFPEEPSPPTVLEDALAPYTHLGPLRTARTAMQRSFEDLIRLYYVAYSRPQNVLLLVGCNKMLQYATKIKNVATCWRQDETWAWRTDGLPRPLPTVADRLPLRLF
jgi:DNA helicase-2/ATP-dependent DNA helicase PcrA